LKRDTENAGTVMINRGPVLLKGDNAGTYTIRKKVIDDPNRGFGLQDQLQNIYRKDCTIGVPFLNLNYISPECLLSREHADTKPVLVDLAGNSLPTSQIFSYPPSPTLNNLTMMMAHHKLRQETVPMSPKEVAQNARIVAELTSTLKTIFRV